MTVRVRVDMTRCAGHGICVLILGQEAGLDAWGFPVVDAAGTVDGRLLRRARRAAAACPRGALVVDEVPERPGSAGGQEPGVPRP